jgi:flavin reductase (DIM6/NTAB) family NADH-FMN oxidoreductase RutF
MEDMPTTILTVNLVLTGAARDYSAVASGVKRNKRQNNSRLLTIAISFRSSHIYYRQNSTANHSGRLQLLKCLLDLLAVLSEKCEGRFRSQPLSSGRGAKTNLVETETEMEMTKDGSTDESLAAGLGRIPSGLFVLTFRHGKRETGMLASWVQQCSFDPPLITAAIRKERDVLAWLTEGASFTVNVIPEGGKALVVHFGKGFELGEPAFNGLELKREADSPPILMAAHAYLACRVRARLEAGDHVLVVGHVEKGGVLHAGHPTVHIRKNGLKY